MSYDAFRPLREEILKLIQGLVKLDSILKDKPTKRLTLDRWEDIRIADIYLRIFPAILSYADKVDRSQFESLERLRFRLFYLAQRIQSVLLERNRVPDLEFNDKLDRFATNKYVKERAEDFITLLDKYTNSDPGAVNTAILEVNKWLRTIEPDARLFRGVPGEEDTLEPSAPAPKHLRKDNVGRRIKAKVEVHTVGR